jgi:hypothetical protein
MRRLRFFVIAFFFIRPLALAAQETTLQEDTQAAEKRIQQWDEENKKIEKKETWEIPVVATLMAVGVVFYVGGPRAGVIACGVGAAGLTFHFWPSGHPASVEPVSP